jgi:putative protein-disulfide isomerase
MVGTAIFVYKYQKYLNLLQNKIKMKHIFCIALFTIAAFTLHAKTNQKMKVIYVYDALCGWCYGFSPVMEQFEKKYKSTVDIEVLSGGMIVGNRIGPIGEVAPYIKWAYKEVEKTTGVKFGKGFLENILEDGKTLFTSIPPSIALTVFKTKYPEKSVAFAAQFQKAIYYTGINPSDYSVYGKLAASFGWDENEFVAAMKNKNMIAATEKEFTTANHYGVTGFPCVLVVKDGKAFKIAEGYTSLENLEASLLKFK